MFLDFMLNHYFQVYPFQYKEINYLLLFLFLHSFRNTIYHIIMPFLMLIHMSLLFQLLSHSYFLLNILLLLMVLMFEFNASIYEHFQMISYLLMKILLLHHEKLFILHLKNPLVNVLNLS